MGELFETLSDKHQDFIARQHIFFTGSAAETGRVNISPRPTDVLRVINANKMAYLDYVGSGNEVAAHTRRVPRLTIMMCAFEGPPRIMRLSGKGATFTKDTPDYARLLSDHFDNTAPRNARQIVTLDIDTVQTSCGYGVPLFDYVADRPNLSRWADAKTDAELVAYRTEKNSHSVDGFETGAV